jgi:hypothetical protein
MFDNNYITSVVNQSVCLFVLRGNAGEVSEGIALGLTGLCINQTGRRGCHFSCLASTGW